MSNERRGPYRRRDEQDEDFYEQDYEYEPRPRRRTAYPSSRPPQPRYTSRYVRPQRQPRKRRVWPFVLAGCALGIFSTVLAAAVIVFLTIRSAQGGGLSALPGIGTKTFPKEQTQNIPLATVSQIQVCDKVGNVTIKVDPNATKTTVTTKKIVHESSQSAADQEFQRISIEVQPPDTLAHPLACVKPWATPTATPEAPTTPPTVTSTTNSSSMLATAANPANALTVNVTFPDPYKVNDEVDVTINMPPSALPTEGPTMLLDVEAPLGNIDVEGVSGVLSVNGGTGDVTITHAILVDGSHIETGQGNVTFNGLLDIPTDPQKSARYIIQSEHGITVTLPSNTNVTLDANTNVGAINSDFKIDVNNNGGPVSYHGPLNTSAAQPSSSVLVLDVGTGNITIHKAQTQATG